MDEKREIRNTVYDVTVSDGEDSRTVEGYALLFDVPSDGLPFEEVIERGALDGVIEKSNVFALLNHDERRGILARSKSGTLKLEVDARGLKYRFDAPRTSLGDELIEYLKRGEITESSFAFSVAEEEWELIGEDEWKRTIKKFNELYDVSPVYDAAYSKTSVYTRGLDVAKKALDKRLKDEIPSDYYSNILNQLN